MPKVSRISVDKKKMDRFYDDFWSAVALLETKKEVREFLFDLLTHTERKMLAKRLQIAMMLLEGYDYQAIRENIKVTDGTIARINNWLKTGATGLIRVTRELIGLKKEVKKGESGGRYLAGNLLMPAAEAGLDLAARQLRKYRRRKLT